MCKMIDQYADKTKGQFFFDRIIINGYFCSLLSEQTRIGYLVLYGYPPLRDFTAYFKNVADQLVKQNENSAQELGRPLDYLFSAGTGRKTLRKTSFCLPL